MRMIEGFCQERAIRWAKLKPQLSLGLLDLPTKGVLTGICE